MPTTTLPVADDGRPSGEPVDGQRESAIGAGVLAALGRLGQLYRVAVVPLRGPLPGERDDRGRPQIPHSYFVAADGRGNILESPPVIRKKY